MENLYSFLKLRPACFRHILNTKIYTYFSNVSGYVDHFHVCRKQAGRSFKKEYKFSIFIFFEVFLI